MGKVKVYSQEAEGERQGRGLPRTGARGTWNDFPAVIEGWKVSADGWVAIVRVMTRSKAITGPKCLFASEAMLRRYWKG